MEHGLTPSVIATRMIYASAPEALQSAVAAGLLGVGSTFVGSMEHAVKLLDEVLGAEEGEQARAVTIAKRYRESRQPLPGFGHHLHKPDDPRSARLIALARDHGVPGNYLRALETLSHGDRLRSTGATSPSMPPAPSPRCWARSTSRRR